MPLSPSFTISNNSGLSQNTFSITDTSTGSDGAVTKFVVLVYDDANNQIPGSPVTLPYSANATYNISILTQDLAVNVVVQWQNVGGTVLYTTSLIFVFTGYLEWFDYGLIQQIAANDSLIVDRNFKSDMYDLRLWIDNANQAINVGTSIFNAEAMILLAQQMVNNPNLYF